MQLNQVVNLTLKYMNQKELQIRQLLHSIQIAIVAPIEIETKAAAKNY